MLNILFHYYYYNYTDFSNDILVQEDTINSSRTVKQMRWVCSGEVKFQTNLTNNRNCYYRLPWFAIFPNFLKVNKHTEPMDSVCCSGTLGMCLISFLSFSLIDKLKALSPCGVPASPTQNSLNTLSDWKHVPLFKQTREQSGFGF